jgi:glycine cleavage system H protein
MIPEKLRYLQTHEWAKKNVSSGIVTVGITDFAVEHLGDIVFLELPQSGTEVAKGACFGTIDSVKAASDLYAPVGGVIVEVNEQLCEKLELFKSDPYGQAWMIKIKPADPEEFDALMDADTYQQHLKGC